MARGLSLAPLDLAYWGISTADTTSPLNDGGAGGARRTRPGRNKVQAPDPRSGRNVAAVQHSLKESGSGATPKPNRSAEKGRDVDIAPLPTWEPAPDVTPPKIPNFEPAPTSASKAEAHWELAGDPPFPSGILHPRPAGRQGPRRPSRTVITLSVLACVVVVLVAATAIVASLDNPTPAGPPAASTPKALSSSEISRARSATESALTATTKAQQGLHSLTGIPTIPTVTAVITPYISSLQQYQAFLAGSKVPAAARGARNNAAAVVNRDLQHLDTINGLASLRLGAYLEQFGTDKVELQTTLSTFEQVLRTSIPR